MEFTRTSSGVDLETLTGRAEKAFRGRQKILGRDIARVGRRAVLNDVKSRRRGGLSFSGMKVRLGASTDVQATAVGVTVTIKATPPGPWSIVEHGAAAHEIIPKKARQGRDGRPPALLFDGLYSASVGHPGSGPRPVWYSTEAALDDAVGPLIMRSTDDVLLGVA